MQTQRIIYVCVCECFILNTENYWFTLGDGDGERLKPISTASWPTRHGAAPGSLALALAGRSVAVLGVPGLPWGRHGVEMGRSWLHLVDLYGDLMVVDDDEWLIIWLSLIHGYLVDLHGD